jgi:hypothetical protein
VGDDAGARGAESGAVVAALGTDVAPPVDEPERLVPWQLIGQARACQVMGSPLYAHLLTTAAQDVLAGGALAELLLPRARPGRGDAAGLRLMAAVHRLVLSRQAPALALHYPSVGGTVDLASVGRAFVATVRDHLDQLVEDVERPCQTNEVGRAAGLLVGLLTCAGETGLPLALREVGAAAGLNLRLDRWRYELPGGVTVGDPHGEVVLRDRWRAPPPHADAPLRVVDRRGCDLAPIDPTTEEGRLALSASVWADQVDRFERLGGALRTAARLPATVDRAAASTWTAEHVVPTPGRVMVLYHSIVEEYLPAEERDAFHAAAEAAGAAATPDAPVAWLRMEPSTGLRHHAVSLRLWPHAPEERYLATTGAHGDDVTPR